MPRNLLQFFFFVWEITSDANAGQSQSPSLLKEKFTKDLLCTLLSDFARLTSLVQSVHQGLTLAQTVFSGSSWSATNCNESALSAARKQELERLRPEDFVHTLKTVCALATFVAQEPRLCLDVAHILRGIPLPETLPEPTPDDQTVTDDNTTNRHNTNNTPPESEPGPEPQPGPDPQPEPEPEKPLDQTPNDKILKDDMIQPPTDQKPPVTLPVDPVVPPVTPAPSQPEKKAAKQAGLLPWPPIGHLVRGGSFSRGQGRAKSGRTRTTFF